MIIEVGGVSYTNFISAECRLSLDSLSSFFSFTAAANKGAPLPLRVGQSCKVYAADQLVLTGSIESVVVDYDDGDHIVTYAGRDKTADLIDSTIDAIDNISGKELTLKALIDIVISHLGLSIKVIDQVNPPIFKTTEDLPSPEVGQNAFEFIERFARKRQVLLTSDSNGNLVIARNTGSRASGAVQHILGASDNNVLAATFSQNTSDRFRLYKVASGLNLAALDDTGGDVETLTNQSGDVEDKSIRSGRQMVIVSETPMGGAQTSERATWEADVRKARSTTYDCTVAGYLVGIDDGALWRVNKVYPIKDDFINLSAPMLCNSVRFSLGSDGSKTELEFIGQDAYKSEPVKTGGLDAGSIAGILIDDVI